MPDAFDARSTSWGGWRRDVARMRGIGLDRGAAYGVTDTFTIAVVQQHTSPDPPSPE